MGCGVNFSHRHDTYDTILPHKNANVNTKKDFTKDNLQYIEDLIQSKMVIMKPDGENVMIGDFIEDESNGLYYSNTYFMDFLTYWGQKYSKRHYN